MKAIYFEGTPEEVHAALKNLTGASSERGVAAVTIDDAEGHEESGGEEYVSYEFARAVLERKPLNKSHRMMLKTLAEAHPDYVSSHDLMPKLELSSAQFRGFMGAFGRRISYTEDYEEGAFFDQYWDEDLACYQYRLAEMSLKAVHDLGLLDG